MNQTALQIIQKFERCTLTAFWDAKGLRWTNGWGETDGVKEGDVWTQDYADQRLSQRLGPLEDQVKALIHIPITEAALGALIDLAYNAGIGILRGSKAILAINSRDRITAAHQLLDDDHVRGSEDPALLKRRCYEVYVFLDNFV